MSDSPTQRFTRPPTSVDRLGEVTFPLAVRGYDRRAVDEFLDQVRALVADLESRQTREGVVQKALDELGEETAGILQRAHETADEITARSRAQADGRLQRAEREAELVRREADEYAEKVVVDTRLLWEERQRLIEDVRQLADEVLGMADDAMERVKMPAPLETGPGATPPPEPAAPAVDLEPEPTQPFRLGAVEDETPTADDDANGPPEAEQDSGHTVELEALPGGSEEPPERERD
jgi:DivIVA domain-containing protein